MFSSVCALAALPVVAAVPTPFGERSSKCVVEVPEGASIVNTDSGVGLQLATGEVQEVDVAQECREDGVAERYAAQRQGRLTTSTDGWLDNQGFTYNAGFSKFTGSFNVPANPPNPRQPETLYYFFGMENLEGGAVNILQPVLTWGDETEGAVGGWSIWSWACCPSYITFNSKNVGGLHEGMKVDGLIERKDSRTWVIDTAFTDDSGERKNTTLTAQVGSFAYNWADVTLEVYNLTSCDQHSPGKVTFENLELYGATGSKLNPSWSGASRSSCGGVMTVHDTETISVQHSTGSSVVV